MRALTARTHILEGDVEKTTCLLPSTLRGRLLVLSFASRTSFQLRLSGHVRRLGRVLWQCYCCNSYLFKKRRIQPGLSPGTSTGWKWKREVGADLNKRVVNQDQLGNKKKLSQCAFCAGCVCRHGFNHFCSAQGPRSGRRVSSPSFLSRECMLECNVRPACSRKTRTFV